MKYNRKETYSSRRTIVIGKQVANTVIIRDNNFDTFYYTEIEP